MELGFNHLIDYGIPAITGVVAWLSKDRILNVLNIKQKKTEVEDARIRTIQGNLDLYQEMLSDLDERYKRRLAELEAEIEKFRQLSEEMSTIIKEQKEFIDEQTIRLREYKFKFGNLK